MANICQYGIIWVHNEKCDAFHHWSVYNNFPMKLKQIDTWNLFHQEPSSYLAISLGGGTLYISGDQSTVKTIYHVFDSMLEFRRNPIKVVLNLVVWQALC